MDLNYLIFKNQIKDSGGVIVEAGTPQNAQNFNHGRQETLAAAILAASNAVYAHWRQQDAENSEVVECTSSTALTAGTAATIAIPKVRNHTGYLPVIAITTASAAVAIKISDKQLNGFKLTAVGGDATVSVGVRGGMW
ncbi:hypothetical protein [Eubacterium barkeri]|uniref:Uncharacterized protein n=1 Tax=Eubacterium barkeri TaxID=1528 RepID=A0A1H3BMP0_EUBBA|nr:hypothetical protein [Eubacterium barkeri]SDX42369.1 hypothetical protein SAMN04488579_102113 [Eubacterium barkeri]